MERLDDVCTSAPRAPANHSLPRLLRRKEDPGCNGGGWIFGHLIDGVQAEYARVPFADNSVYKIPEGMTDEQILYLSDILPTGYEVGMLNGQVQPGDVVAMVGTGPIGLP